MKGLNEKIKDSGVKKAYIASFLNISSQSLSNKLSGRTEFSASEAINIKELINLTDEEFFHFFCSKS